MNLEDDFSRANVAIIGLGLMGGSLAMALKNHCQMIMAVDQDLPTLQNALSDGLIQQASTDASEILPQADLIILAVPVLGVLKYLAQVDQLHPDGNAVVLDLGSTKTKIVEAMAGLPDRFDPIGGHPMCGREKAGLKWAVKDLYQDAPFALCPLQRTTERAKFFASRIVQIVGARPLWINPTEHDAWTAATSHVPYLISNTLAGSTPEEVIPLIGPGFRSTTRLASSSRPMMMDIMATNRENVLSALDQFIHRIEQVEHALETQSWDDLDTLLSEGALRQSELMGGY